MQLAKRVWDFSTSRGLLRPGDRVVMGVSGGPDSLCLLDVLHRLAGRHHLELVVACLDHGLRPESASEAEFVRSEADRRGCAFVTEVTNVQLAAKTSHQSVETAARDLRYDFLSRVAGQAGAHLIAVAHTADDQAETMLLHLLRGTGLRGLGGMRPRRAIGESLSLIRPLLQTSKSEILAYCAEHNLKPHRDSSNADTRFLRNRVRHELMPVLEAYNPNLRVGLARLADSAAGDYEIWLGAMQGLWQQTARLAGPRLDESPSDGAGEGTVAFERQQWLALSRPERLALLRLAIEHLTGDLDETNFAPIDAAAEFSRQAKPGRSCQVAAGLMLKVETEQIKVVRAASQANATNWPRMAVDALAPGWRLVVETLERDAWSQKEIAAAPRWTAYVDAGRLAGPVRLRRRLPADRFRPLGMSGHTVKLSDFFVNRKVPAAERANWPLVICSDEIVWVVGLGLDERFKVSETTHLAKRLEVRRTEAE